MNFDLDFYRAQDKPELQANFRDRLSDFIVTEELGFSPSEEGEHLLVNIKKRGENSPWLAKQIAKYFKVKNVDVGFCGMKDRHAETSQWFSVYLPGKPQVVDWPGFVEFSLADIDILSSARHFKKLRRGSHQSNHFTISLRELSFTEKDNLSALQDRLARIKQVGVPNYFGEQRFGREGSNLALVQEWVVEGKSIANREKRSFAMSAARSYLFNRLLEQRVKCGTWNQIIDGELMVDSKPSGPMWGRGRSGASGDAAILESDISEAYSAWCQKLEHCGLKQERRPLVLLPENFSWNIDGSLLILSFTLRPGEFATSILREIALLKDLSQKA